MSKNNIHFDISERKILLRILDIVCVLLLLYLVGIVFNFDYFKINSEHWVWSIVLAAYLTVFATIFELYNLQKASKFDVVVKNVIITSSVTVLFYLLTPFYTPMLPTNRLQIVYFFVAINVAMLAWRYAYIVLVSAPRFYKRVLLVANACDVEAIMTSLQKSDPNYRVIGYVNTGVNDASIVNSLEIDAININDIATLTQEMTISEIVVGTPISEGMTVELNNQLIKLLEIGIPIREYTQVYEELTYRIPVQHVEKDFYRYFPFSRSNQNKLYLFFNRVLDLIFSIVGLIVGIVLFPILIIGNALANRGPFFYSQTRVGKNGKHFKIYKLRSMIINAEKDGAQFAKTKDVRVTKFGRFLRKSRFDEIPQFINVIKGEMSVIGPRPERPEFVEDLKIEIPFYEVRHLVKPGVTGWAQVNAKYGASQEDSLEKLQYDLYYIKHRSLFLDITIIIKTLSTIIFFRGQ
ncbi:exopolysaccharide biosynthesis polyprenyl glycosylphosphotransferase [Aequorivita sublithincola DSM 14238]|uniref:Exopolysaccharide biosynthesis polyprenyl glycosylphosphotransferase n=1 Tax=Aequorivita sublithincola (strain DSM 14238 / LMG 21431 / ACAM 643 / 9-3) TaxID=746697 RepID=I3YXJ8_AEQSU|nr:sugar transferase [Aequorivita sublithincola]AFL81716.1 exopolysaccharide biosynthesis polyprenyl glycosylphosphotransferase [Aequorivita sublithincola DSM 14238]